MIGPAFDGNGFSPRDLFVPPIGFTPNEFHVSLTEATVTGVVSVKGSPASEAGWPCAVMISTPRSLQIGDLAKQGRACECEAAGLIDEARGWYTLAINIDPLDRHSQSARFHMDAAVPGVRAPLFR